MNITKCYLTENRCYKTGRKIKPTGIMVHSTGANNPELRRYVQPDDGILGTNKYGNDWNRSNLSVCVHAFIGKDRYDQVRCYQTLPWNHRGWHAGGAANDTHISFEICEDDLKDAAYFVEVYNMSVQLCASLAAEYDIDTDNVICHSEGYKLGIASDHADVMHWFPRFGKDMDDFRRDVKAAMEDDLNMTIDEARTKLTTIADTGGDHSDWAEDAIKTFVDAEIVNGDGNGNYGWNQCITREAMVKILFNFAEKLNLLDELK